MHPLVTLTLLGPLAALFGLVGQMVHRGRAPSDAERSAGAGVAGLKQLIEAREWGAALPALLISGGLLWTMTCGALAAAFAFEQYLTSALMLVVIAWAIWRIAQDYRRA